MVNENEITIWTQLRSVIWSHLYISLVLTAFGFGAFWWFLAQSVWKQIFSVICMVVYFCVLYTKGARCARQDKRSFSKQKPYALKGVVLSLGISAVTLVLWLFFAMTWSFMTIDGNISGYSGVIYNFAFYIWTFCYNGFLGLHQGGIYWYMHIVMYAFPALAVGVGYFAGYKDFSFADRAIAGIYEKK